MKTTDEWRRWVHDHVDMYFDNVLIDRRDFLVLLQQLDDARGQVERISKARDDDRERL
jgi:hypothetical protein